MEELGREAEISEVIEKKGTTGVVLIAKMGRRRKELLEKGWEIRKNWGVGVDEDLTMEERQVRWKLVERVRMERAKGRVVVTTNRRVWVNGKAWGWDTEREEKGDLEKDRKEDGEESRSRARGKKRRRKDGRQQEREDGDRGEGVEEGKGGAMVRGGGMGPRAGIGNKIVKGRTMARSEVYFESVVKGSGTLPVKAPCKS
ncbi:hypothetical protein EAG_08491 [Camponotus floridanus]|uniref:Uncharacterized protein n=1 Tax=Camponotus floridanus TaxID=104421 RepID=E2AX20_CAMFO|nr:hypothetical protein EAG_08491 [Camponotus floridanus]